jgi:hypothetical protein
MLSDNEIKFLAIEMNIPAEEVQRIVGKDNKRLAEVCEDILKNESKFSKSHACSFNPHRYDMTESILAKLSS